MNIEISASSFSILAGEQLLPRSVQHVSPVKLFADLLDRPPFSVPTKMRVLVPILTPSAPLSAQNSVPSKRQWPRTLPGSDTPTLRVASCGCSDRGNLRLVTSPPSDWRTPPCRVAHLVTG